MRNDILKILVGTFFIYIGALIAFDLNLNETKIPITGQSLAVLVVGFLLGRKMGVLAVAVYLLLGIIGLPVFAGESEIELFTEGGKGFFNGFWMSAKETFTQGSGGFLYGFIFAAYVIGWLAEIGFDKSFFKIIIAMILGTLVFLVFGVGHLSSLYGFEKGLEYGLYPFWKGAIVKILLGAGIVSAYNLISKKV